MIHQAYPKKEDGINLTQSYNLTEPFDLHASSETIVEILAIYNDLNTLPSNIELRIQRGLQLSDCEATLWFSHREPHCELITLTTSCPKKILILPGKYRGWFIKNTGGVYSEPTQAELADIKIIIITHDDKNCCIRHMVGGGCAN